MIEALPMDDRGSSLIQIHSWFMTVASNGWLTPPPPKKKWWTWTNYIRSPSYDLPKICIFLFSNMFLISLVHPKKNDEKQPIHSFLVCRMPHQGTRWRRCYPQIRCCSRSVSPAKDSGIRFGRFSPRSPSGKDMKNYISKRETKTGNMFVLWLIFLGERSHLFVWWKTLFRWSGSSSKIHESFMKWDGIEDLFGVEISVTREWSSKKQHHPKLLLGKTSRCLGNVTRYFYIH